MMLSRNFDEIITTRGSVNGALKFERNADDVTQSLAILSNLTVSKSQKRLVAT